MELKQHTKSTIFILALLLPSVVPGRKTQNLYSAIFNTLGELLDRVGKNRVTRGFTFYVTLVSTFYFGWVTLALKK